MSSLAGIFKFDSRNRVSSSELMELVRGIDRSGPDGGGEYLSSNLGMAYRAFHTTPESHFENQPLVCEGYVLTWDGRLDNREEIRTRVRQTFRGAPTDLDLAFAAYKEWGTGCFAELQGDWAIALWDPDRRQLVFARDYIGIRRLYYRLDHDGVAWCSAPEPLVLTAPQKLHLDPDYLAGCFYPRPPIESTPYQEIRAIVPAHFLTFHYDGKQTTERYWSLNPHARIRYQSDEEYEKHFRTIFRDCVREQLRSDRTILAELSGGVDSSSIVCMADRIRKRETGPAIETLSYFDSEEPSGDERPYFSIIEEARGQTGSHISMSDFTRQARGRTFSPLPEDCFTAAPGYFSRSLQWDILIQGILDAKGSRVILSGLGGDEMLGGVQYEAPELAEYLVAGRMISFCHALLAWSLARQKHIPALVRDLFQLFRAKYDPVSIRDSSIALSPWVLVKPAAGCASLRLFTDWKKLSPAKVALEWIRYSLAAQLSCTDLPLVGCAERRYPYLSRALFTFVASIPREQILRPKRRRHLMRRALRGIVPEQVLFRKTKWFGSRSILARIRDDQQSIRQMLESVWVSDKSVIDAAQLNRVLNAIEHGIATEGLQLLSAIGIEQWLRSDVNRRHLLLPRGGESPNSEAKSIDPRSAVLTR